MESNQKIFNKIEQLYNLKDEAGKQKNKTFFSHLIKAYLPLNSVKVAVDKPKRKDNKARCVFSKKELVTLQQAKSSSDTESMRIKMDEFAKSFDSEKGCFTSSTPMNQLFNGKILGIQGSGTETYMSQESFATFVIWIMAKIVEGDKHIKWTLSQMKGVKFHPGIVISDKKPEKKQKPVHAYSTGTSTTTLGDLSALQNLRDKLK
jgi:hypothetical protein